MTHQPPRLNEFGYNIDSRSRKFEMSNILKESANHQVPCWWKDSNQTNDSKLKTRTELLQHRKKSFIPDPSYDLDGDGYVGQQDYVLSKLFDADKDGKLDSEEKKKAH